MSVPRSPSTEFHPCRNCGTATARAGVPGRTSTALTTHGCFPSSNGWWRVRARSWLAVRAVFLRAGVVAGRAESLPLEQAEMELPTLSGAGSDGVGCHACGVVGPASSNQTALQRWIARWNGPVFIVVGAFWLVTIPFTSGVMVLRWTFGVMVLALARSIERIRGSVPWFRQRGR